MSRWRRLRPLLFCVVFLFLLDALVRLWVATAPPYPWDGRFREGDLYPYEIDGALAALGRAKGSFNVVLLGDSVLRGAYLQDQETVRGILQAHLHQDFPGRDIRVWNLAMAGARGADKYAMLKLVAPYHPDLIVMNIDYKFFNTAKLSYPFLADAWQDDQDAIAFDRALGLDPFEEIATHHVKQLWALYRHREWINRNLFGDAPFALVGKAVEPPKVAPDPGSWVDPRLPWTEKHLQLDAHYQSLYRTDAIAPDNANAMAWDRTARFIDRQQMPAFLYWTPQNHRFLAPQIDNPAYEHNRQVVAQLFAGHTLTYKDYDRQLDAGDRQEGAFVDADHLTPAGTRRFADQLYQDLLPQLHQRLQGVRP